LSWRRGHPPGDIVVDKKELEKLYRKKKEQLEAERDVLGKMYEDRVALGQPLTDTDILEQNGHCGNISLEISKLKEMLEEED